LGMMEELGELAHCSLKRIQGIRGFDDHDFYIKNYIDAVGDIGVYASNYAVVHSIHMEWPENRDYELHTSDLCYAMASYWLSTMMITTDAADKRLYHFLAYVDALARKEGTTLAAATTKTWEQVKERNWVKNKEAGI
jgi:hypothetical protein